MSQSSVAQNRGHHALRRGRWSSPGSEYFLTICTERRGHGLTSPPIVNTVLEQAHKLTSDGAWELRTLTVMPDHAHLLISLGSANHLAGSIRLLKGRLAPTLRSSNLKWQRGYFDHCMRPGEDRLPVFRYIFLNPYREHLLATPEKWSAYYCAPQDWSWFEPLTNIECPFPEWLL